MATQLKNCTFNDEVVKKSSSGDFGYEFDASVAISGSPGCGDCLQTNGYVTMYPDVCGYGSLQLNIPIHQTSCGGGSNYFGSTNIDSADISYLNVCGYYSMNSCGSFYGSPWFYSSAYFYSDIYCTGGATYFCGCGAYFNTYASFCGSASFSSDAYFYGGAHFCGCGVDFDLSCGGLCIYSGGNSYYFSGFSGGIPIFTGGSGE